jgi:hypothetical protein
MFGSVVLDVAIGLFFVYVLLSLICSAVRESIESRLKSRALHLERGIRELLRDANSTELARKVYQHPLVSSLYRGDYSPAAGTRAEFRGLGWLWATMRSWLPKGKPTNLPSYIPARNFALALLDLAGRGDTYRAGQHGGNTAANPGADALLTVAHIRASLANLGNPYVERAVLTALDTARDDLELAILNLQKWYDSGMDRVSGWYKHETQRILFMVGLIVTVALNVDTIAIVKHLAVNKEAREALAKQATASVRDPALVASVEAQVKTTPAASSPAPANSTPTETAAAQAPVAAPLTQEALNARIKAAEAQTRLMKEQLFGLGLPVGWSEMRKGAATRPSCAVATSGLTYIVCAVWPHDWGIILAALPGWLITAFAVSFGAPFWFDMLNKMMVVRSTVKPHEKSPEESSEDRQRPARLPQPAAAQASAQIPRPG